MGITGACNYERLPDGTHAAEPCYTVPEGHDLNAAADDLRRVLGDVLRCPGVLTAEIVDVDESSRLLLIGVQTSDERAMARALRRLSAAGCCTGIG